MSKCVTLEREADIGLIRVDKPPVNALYRDVRVGLQAAFDEVAADPGIRALVIYSAGRTFVAGGDILDFSAPDFEIQSFVDFLARLESFDRPVVAAMHGIPLGGGLELALACHYRIALPTTRVGLPEVTLGLIPGAGGTQRLPRLAGVRKALDMILGGAPVTAPDAKHHGIIDDIVEGDIRAAGIDYARGLLARGDGPRRTSEREVDASDLPAGYFAERRTALGAKASLYPALSYAVSAVEAAATRPFEDGMAEELRLFEQSRVSPQSAAMRHLFFAKREAAKIPGVPANVPLLPVRRIAVIGAGTMGGGIAMSFVNAGIPVLLVDTSDDALARGLDTVRRNYVASAARGSVSVEEVAQRMARLSGTVRLEDVGDCDLVIEAVFENLALKTQVCAQLGKVCRPGAIIATNTSTLDVDVLAQASGRPDHFIGMHFFSPANVMRLLEVVRGACTAPAVLATVVRLAGTLGKVAVVSGVCYGFIGNRMLESYLREAEFLMLEGATPDQIDRAIESLGLAMGPCRMLDLAGLDVAAKVVIEHRLAGGLPPDARYRVVVQKMFELGRFGQKSGSGYYRYDGRAPLPDPEVAHICRALAEQYGVTQRTDITDNEIVERCMYPLINEGARVLEKGIAYRPGDIDMVWTCGYGFPDHRGGPMHMADSIGISTIVDRLAHYAQLRGDAYGYWTRAPLMERLAQTGGHFADALHS